MRNMQVPVHAAKKVGLYTAGGVVYTVSPVHTDDYYARKTRELVSLGVDAVYIKDPSGLLTPERAHTLVPVAQGRMRKVAAASAFALPHRTGALYRVPGRRARRGRRPHRNLGAGQWCLASRHRMVR